MNNAFLFTLLFLFIRMDLDFKIEEIKRIKEVSGASGILLHDHSFFIIGDDTPLLFRYDKKLRLEDQLRIHPDTTEGNIILKKDKPDFEAITKISQNQAVIFGSGSKSPERDEFVLVSLESDNPVERYPITLFYNYLKDKEIMQDSELNIEAAAFFADTLFLFNRRKTSSFISLIKNLLIM